MSHIKITPDRLFVGLFIVATIFITAGFFIQKCWSDKPDVVLPKPMQPHPTKTDTATPKPAPKAVAARQGAVNLAIRYPLPRKPLPAVTMPALSPNASLTAILQRRIEVLTQEKAMLSAALATSDSVLGLTRYQLNVVIDDDDRQIKQLQDTLKVRAERFDGQIAAAVATNKVYAKALRNTKEDLADEMLINRVFGIGRKKAVRVIYVKIPKVPETE